VTPPRPAYPITPRPGDDRFTHHLIADLATVLTAHGYPTLLTNNDRLHLTNRLYAAIYREENTFDGRP
jgi:hypothetical protein